MKQIYLILFLSALSIGLRAEGALPWMRAINATGEKYEFEPGVIVSLHPAMAGDVPTLTVKVRGEEQFTGARSIVLYTPGETPMSVEEVKTHTEVPFYVEDNTIRLTDTASDCPMRIYSVSGMDMTRANGHLPSGAYIVVIDNQPYKTLIP